MKKPITLPRITAIILVFEAILLLVPQAILGLTINWPASLDLPAHVNFPLILENYTAVMTGYSIYLIYSLLFWPLAYLTGRVVIGKDDKNILFKIANGFAVLSVMARSLGIVRWLFTIPLLAKIYTAPGTTVTTQAKLSLIYDMLNFYAGGIGELLGVSLFAVIWLVLICLLILRHSNWPNWLGYFGLLAAFSLCMNLAEVLGVEMGIMITLSVVLLHFWYTAMAVEFLKRDRIVPNN